MKLTTRFKRLTVWNKLAAIGAICSILAFLGWLLWPKGTGDTAVRIEADQKAVVQAPMHSPGSVMQTMSDSPGGRQVAGDYVVQSKPRKLLPHTIEAMQLGLAASPKLGVKISVPLSDGESFQLGQQIKAVLEQAGWNVGKVAPVIADPPIKPGITLWFWQRPTGAMQAVFAPVFDQFDYERVAYNDSNFPQNTVKIYIGSR